MNTWLVLLAVTVAVALTFDFLNGFHDAANSIATVVSDPGVVTQAGCSLGCVLQLRGGVFTGNGGGQDDWQWHDPAG